MSTVNPLDPNAWEAEFFLYHRGGPWWRASFRCANDAFVWQEGNRGRRWAEMFFITDKEGNEVTLRDQPRHPGHAYAIMAATGEPKVGS